MIQVANLSNSFGSQLLFDDVSFNINQKERIGLVGRNGHGKTTLFRIIIGEEQADSGEVSIPRNYRIGYVTQQLLFSEQTVLSEACRGLPEHLHGETWMAEKILSGLGFTKQDMGRNTSGFSGGYQVRLGLARVLVSEPDLLLLDEPTTYLDVPPAVEERAHGYNPRSLFHGQRYHAYDGNPPQEDTPHRRRHRQIL